MSEAHKLRAQLRALRDSVKGKTFEQASEAFKDIEGLKVRLAKIDPPAARPKTLQVRRHQRERRQ